MSTAAMTMRRREFHAATARTATTHRAAAQMLTPFLGRGRCAAVHPEFEFKPGFIYAKVRAIAARINQNYDGWPSTGLEKSYRTFIGKPIFVNHQNKDWRKARGKVVAARYVEAGDDKYIETVMEVDARRFPKLAHEIITGGLDSVSMGVEAGFTICSYCGNKAVDTPEFCAHVKYHKGERLPRLNTKTGAKEDVLVYEKCYKLGFFELSWVFDPADETAVTSRVIAAAAAEPLPPPDEMIEGQMPEAMMPQARRHHYAYGEIEAPEDVDTLRDESDDDNDDFHHYIESPKELRGPDLDQTKQLDRTQEEEGLDRNRRAEEVEDIGGAPMPTRNARKGRRRQARPAPFLVDPRTGRRYYAAEDDEEQGPPLGDDEGEGGPPPDFDGEHDDEGDDAPPEDGEDDEGGDDFGGPSDDGGDVGDDMMGGPPPPDDGMGGDPGMGGGEDISNKSDADLLAEAESDLQHAQGIANDDFSMDPGSDAGGTGDDYSDEGDPFGGGGDEFGGEGGPGDTLFGDDGSDEHGHIDPDGDGDDDSDPVLDFDRSHHPELGTHPAVQEVLEALGGGGGGHQARRNGNNPGSNRNRRRGGSPMSLSQRGRVATAGRRRHYAGEDGTMDGGPYHTDDNDQGEKEDTFISETPGAEAVAAPTPGDGTISNTENNLVAKINRQARELRRNMIAYEQITGRRLTAGATEEATEVNPTVNTGPGGEELTGDDFESLQPEKVETQPKDASRRYFNAFDQWLTQTTGRRTAQHTSAFIRRQAARYCAHRGWNNQVLFPALGIVLREAKKNEATRRSAMKRQADESLEVAAPQDRIDVEAPVRDTTDAEAQSTQFPLGDFGDNAGDNLADPDLDTNSQIWAPGEGDSSVTKDSNRKADGITAVRYAEAYIEAGLGDPQTDPAQEKWKIAGMARNMRHGTIVDRIALLDAVNTVNRQRRAAARTAARTSQNLPQGMGGGRPMTASTHQAAANDTASSDLAFWVK